jgi:Fic-DOC domain mobile mystery protein B
MTMAWKSIPGETPIDISGLKIAGITNRDELSIVEAENLRKAIVKYLGGSLTRRTAKFDLSWMLKLHSEMFRDVWVWAGKTRTTDLNLGAPWHQVSSQLHNLCEDLAYWRSHWPDVLEQAAHLHHRAVQIHPFLNGNGRWARLLANIWLKLNRLPLTEWPEDSIGATSVIRDDYLAAVRAADAGNYAPLIEMHRRYSAKVP